MGTVEVDTGKMGFFVGDIRQMSPDGSRIVYLGRSETAGSEQPAAEQAPADAVYAAHADGSASRRVVTQRQLYELTPNKAEFELGEMTIGNTKWRCDGRYILVANFVHPRPEVRRSLYLVKKDGSEARWLCHFGHHHSWSPDGASILFNDRKAGSGFRMHLIDFDGTNRRLVTDAIEGSHPLMSADGRRIVDFDHKGIFVVDVGSGSVERLSLYRNPFRMDIAGTHPHVAWNHDGTQVLYKSAETGHSELYLIPDAT
jgi:Tol biopolymer transport system component